MTTSSQHVAMMRAFPRPIVYRPRRLFHALARVEETETEDEGTRKRRMDEVLTVEQREDTKRPCDGPLASNAELLALYEELVAQAGDASGGE